eukprot:gene1476-15908_t
MTNLHTMIENGVTVDYVKNVFPTNTYPNHQSIVTGLYPENHGIIDNRMFDPTNGTIFEPGVKDERWWNKAEPLWITNQKQGFLSGVGYWPGYEVTWNGTRANLTFEGSPPYVKDNKKSLNFNKRVDTAVKWLEKCKNVTFVALYFEEPDATTHDHGADSNKTKVKDLFKTALSNVDLAIGHLIEKLNSSYLLNETNIIIIGDHGSMNTSHEKVIDIDKYVDSVKTMRYLAGFTYASVWPKAGKLMEIYNKLKGKNPHLKVYLRKEIPEVFHIKKCNRTAPLILMPDPGWIISAKKEKVPYLKEDFCRGEHGYTNMCRKMNPGFLAFGPAFKKKFEKESIESVDIYELICRILGIKPNKNDGKLERTKDFLVKDL